MAHIPSILRSAKRLVCAALEVPPAYLSQYKSGKGTHGRMSPAHLDTRYERFFAAIARAGLPTVIPTAANDDGLCHGGTPLASAGGGQPQTHYITLTAVVCSTYY